MNPKPRLNSPAQAVERIAIIHPPILSQSFSDQAVSKLLMERMLRYSSWSAPPPANSLSVYTRLASYPSVLSSSYLIVAKTSSTQTVLDYALRISSTDMSTGFLYSGYLDHQTIQPSATRGGEAKSVLG